MIRSCDFHEAVLPEISALRELTRTVADKMYSKLLVKFKEGWEGWDDPDALPILKSKLIDHILKGFDPENMIDVMNLAAMIWNIQQP